MVLSVIIVNYHVRYFLELCLRSVQTATQSIESEIIVVDNDPADGSLAYLRPLFPAVRFIANKENTGFGRANNLALTQAKGEFILFLNPDTILPEDFVKNALAFYGFTAATGIQRTPGDPNAFSVPGVSQTPTDPNAFSVPAVSQTPGNHNAFAVPAVSQTPADPNAFPVSSGVPTTPGVSPTPRDPATIGALGVRMIDGSGQFLKESRRGFPSAWVAFCKLSGLTALFPKSRLFSTYYLGYLSAETTHPAPVLSGACLWVPRSILEKTGGFDEQFFMYAEDIDLSYRIEKAGYTNYYLATTTIVHFKGESTRKDARYVKLFYKAMSQFRRKHFGQGLSALFNTAMDIAIWLRAGIRAIGLSTRPTTPARPETPVPTYLIGDPSSIEVLKNNQLFTRGRVFVEAPGQANDLILCEGPQFSFKDCIKALAAAEAWRSSLRVKFYARNNGSILGSVHRDGRGEVEVL